MKTSISAAAIALAICACVLTNRRPSGRLPASPLDLERMPEFLPDLFIGRH